MKCRFKQVHNSQTSRWMGGIFVMLDMIRYELYDRVLYLYSILSVCALKCLFGHSVQY